MSTKPQLRIALLVDGKITQEREIRDGESVTFGESSRATFVVPKTDSPGADFVLFQWTDAGHVLRFTPQMRGRVERAGAGGQALARLSATEVDGVFGHLLTVADRGKLVVGAATVLFQFARAPVGAPAGRAADFDPRLLQADDGAFVGFLAVWGVLASFLGVWVAFTDPPEPTISAVHARIVVPPRVDAPPAFDAAPEPVAQRPVRETAPGVGASDAASELPSRDLLAEARRDLAALIGSTGPTESGEIVRDILGAGGLGDVKAALTHPGPGEASAEGFKRGEGDRAAAVGIDEIGGIGGGGGAGVGGDAARMVEVALDVDDADLSEVTGDPDDISRIVKEHRGDLRRCFEAQLQLNPDLEGRVELAWTVQAGGKATRVRTVSNETDDEALARCVETRIRSWSFGEAEGDVSWPFVFTAR